MELDVSNLLTGAVLFRDWLYYCREMQYKLYVHIKGAVSRLRLVSSRLVSTTGIDRKMKSLSKAFLDNHISINGFIYGANVLSIT